MIRGAKRVFYTGRKKWTTHLCPSTSELWWFVWRNNEGLQSRNLYQNIIKISGFFVRKIVADIRLDIKLKIKTPKLKDFLIFTRMLRQHSDFPLTAHDKSPNRNLACEVQGQSTFVLWNFMTDFGNCPLIFTTIDEFQKGFWGTQAI